MRVMVFVKATEDSEAGFSLTTEAKKMMQEMDKFNNELRAAGILEDAGGLTPSSEGIRDSDERQRIFRKDGVLVRRCGQKQVNFIGGANNKAERPTFEVRAGTFVC